ncbi:MAG: nucleoside triphosphate pyrophosphohydrolase [Anaerolineales bacterium]|nr:nucleoside triphosphate pyrophosphohydrolase [Anaerolineales bacterium]
MKYHKLVRDKIPEIIRQNGRISVTRILGKDEYAIALRQKLQEEVEEFLESGALEELADILEVVYALATTNATIEQLERLRHEKHEERGGFAQSVFLVEVLERAKQVLPETAVKEQAVRYQTLLAKLPRVSESDMDLLLQAREQVESEPELDSETMQKVQAKIANAQNK